MRPRTWCAARRLAGLTREKRPSLQEDDEKGAPSLGVGARAAGRAGTAGPAVLGKLDGAAELAAARGAARAASARPSRPSQRKPRVCPLLAAGRQQFDTGFVPRPCLGPAARRPLASSTPPFAFPGAMPGHAARRCSPTSRARASACRKHLSRPPLRHRSFTFSFSRRIGPGPRDAWPAARSSAAVAQGGGNDVREGRRGAVRGSDALSTEKAPRPRGSPSRPHATPPRPVFPTRTRAHGRNRK